MVRWFFKAFIPLVLMTLLVVALLSCSPQQSSPVTSPPETVNNTLTEPGSNYPEPPQGTVAEPSRNPPKPDSKETTQSGNPRQNQPPPEINEDLMYEVYPVTDSAPVLELYWGPPDIGMDNIARFTPYGIWEGSYEPATEMQFYTHSSHDPVYAPCPGTIVSIFGGADPNTGNIAGGVTIRYGRNFSVTLQHVVDVHPDLKVGDKVEAKTLVGYTQGQNGVGWWEIEAAVRIDNVIRTQPPYDFFSPESKKKLDSIIPAAKKKEESPYSSWTVTNTDVPSDPSKGMGSWIQDFGGKKEWWASGERMGIKGNTDSLSDFLKANNKEALIPYFIGGPGQPVK